MNRIAAEIAKEIRVFFEHDDVDAGAREQEAEHHARGAAAGNAALRFHDFTFSRRTALARPILQIEVTGDRDHGYAENY